MQADNSPICEWKISDECVPYPLALQTMQDRVAQIALGTVSEQIWLLEHPPLITAGTSANKSDLLKPDALPVFEAGRGGQYTYHGPGQRIAYVMLDLNRRGRDIRKLVADLEQWIIQTMAAFNIETYTVPGRVGVWTKRPDNGAGREDKIAAIGIRVRKWVSFHGISLNISPDLDDYKNIVPCGISDQGVTSMEDLGQLVSMAEVDVKLRENFELIFGPSQNAE